MVWGRQQGLMQRPLDQIIEAIQQAGSAGLTLSELRTILAPLYPERTVKLPLLRYCTFAVS